MAEASLQAIVAGSVVQDDAEVPSAGEMCEGLAADHSRVAARLHQLVDVASEHGDPVTEDLAIARAAFHEKAAWMLRAISRG